MHSFVTIPMYAYTCLALVQAAAAYGPLCQFNVEAHLSSGLGEGVHTRLTTFIHSKYVSHTNMHGSRLQHCKSCTPGTPQDTDIYYNHVGRCTLAILICYCCCMF
ncbi:hypothetical protein B0H10DRAFT_2108514 [Mycena sp. CBHHK59/15]|nr:hypothetical protein B0H10DRAFT_2108514 [Mycena sp. CBHHK59/15]